VGQVGSLSYERPVEQDMVRVAGELVRSTPLLVGKRHSGEKPDTAPGIFCWCRPHREAIVREFTSEPNFAGRPIRRAAGYVPQGYPCPTPSHLTLRSSCWPAGGLATSKRRPSCGGATPNDSSPWCAAGCPHGCPATSIPRTWCSRPIAASFPAPAAIA